MGMKTIIPLYSSNKSTCHARFYIKYIFLRIMSTRACVRACVCVRVCVYPQATGPILFVS